MQDTKDKKFQNSHFSKKKKLLDEQETVKEKIEETHSQEDQTVLSHEVKIEEAEIETVLKSEVLEKKESKELDVAGLINDIANNKYFPITTREARSIVEKMVSRGPESLLGENWFLSGQERKELFKVLRNKYSF